MQNPYKDPLFRDLIKVFTLVFFPAVFATAIINTIAILVFHCNDFFPVIVIILVCAPVSHYVFYPRFKQLEFAKRATHTAWLILPLLVILTMPAAVKYFTHVPYSVVAVNDPAEILKLRKEKFFAIKEKRIPANSYTMQRDKQRYKQQYIDYYAYFVTPILGKGNVQDTGKPAKIALGIRYEKRLYNHDMDYPDSVKNFFEQAEIDYNLNEHKEFDYLEKINNTNDYSDYTLAWNRNRNLDQSAIPLILVEGKGSLADRKKAELFSFLLILILTYLGGVLMLSIDGILKWYMPDGW